jgi:predicted AlkP superfamily pyrophosphatase or phosphodiesterase
MAHRLADMPYSKRPHLMAVYAPEVDQAGHRSGPVALTRHPMIAHDNDVDNIGQVALVDRVKDALDERGADSSYAWPTAWQTCRTRSARI